MGIRQKGFSLVELMISITLGLMLMAGVVQMFMGSRVTFSTQQAISRVQETGRLAVEMIGRDVRMAGFSGCLSRTLADGTSLVNTVQSSTSYPYNFNDSVHGYTTKPNDAPLSPAPLANSDILTLTAIEGSVPASIVTTANTQDTVFVRKSTVVANGCASSVSKLNGFCPGDFLITSDCESGVIFQASNIAINGTNLDISHASSGTPGNATAVWASTDKMTVLPGAGGFVNKLNRISYFVANNTAGVPSLYQNLNGQNLELLENVERIALQFGVDTTVNADGTGDGSPDEYKTISNITTAAQWKKVVSVRIQLLVRSADDNVVNDITPYYFNDATHPITPTDKRMRQVFINTMAIRNRVR